VITNLSAKLKSIYRNELNTEAVYSDSNRKTLSLTPANGKTFFCPICEKWHRRFLPFGLYARKNAECPTCGSLERHRFMWRHLCGPVGVMQRRLEVLHIAPEMSIEARLSNLRNLRYRSIDLYNPLAGEQMDLTALRLESATFDLVICSHVLEHIEEDHLAISEMARVLRPGGTLIAMVPVDTKLSRTFEDASITDPLERHTAFGHPYHVRICGMDYDQRISEGGFNVRTYKSRQMLPHQRRVERINRALLYHCTK
jgi:SAM-dependent methyltransferase